jgi:hypothetical protein
VETNASWATTDERVDEILSRLARAGLSSLLVSLSPFHAELVFEQDLSPELGPAGFYDPGSVPAFEKPTPFGTLDS